MKILVTGANGYLGQGIVNSILNNGHEVVAADFNTQYVNDEATKVSCNLFEVEKPFEEFGEPDVLLHLAWRDGFVHYSDAHIEDLPKHYGFIRNMIESGVKRVAIMGSMHEVGFFEGSINEDTPCHPMTPYAISKNALRDLTQMLTRQKSIKFQWLRGYYIVGNSKFGSSVFSKLAFAAANGDEFFPCTLGQNQYDFIDYKVFCNQVAAAVSQSDITGIIEICSGRPEKLADRMERFLQENELKIKLKYGAFPDRLYDTKAIWGNNSKIEDVIFRNNTLRNYEEIR